jgi:hypothetical protein
MQAKQEEKSDNSYVSTFGCRQEFNLAKKKKNKTNTFHDAGWSSRRICFFAVPALATHSGVNVSAVSVGVKEKLGNTEVVPTIEASHRHISALASPL